MTRNFLYGILAILSCSLLVEAASGEVKPGKIYRVGGEVKAPRAILQPQPVVDDSSETSKGPVDDVGSTILSIVVATDGSVSKAKVLRGLRRDLDAKALEAVKQWRFEPGTKKGVPVPVELDVQVEFHLYK